jgi:hypothetical protein
MSPVSGAAVGALDAPPGAAVAPPTEVDGLAPVPLQAVTANRVTRASAAMRLWLGVVTRWILLVASPDSEASRDKPGVARSRSIERMNVPFAFR